MTIAQIAILGGFLAVLALLIFAAARSAQWRAITKRSASDTALTMPDAASVGCGSSDRGGCD